MLGTPSPGSRRRPHGTRGRFAGSTGRILPLGLLSATLLSALGCASRGDVDLLEARLRENERELESAESHLDQTRSELQLARQESDLLRSQLSDTGQQPLLAEQADVLLRTAGLKFNSLLTGGLDRDGLPGDDMLSAVLVPQDGNGEPVKLAGEIELELIDLSRPKESQRIGAWNFSADESRELWHRGLLGAGYRLNLPWQQIPESSDVVLHAKLTAPDRREFDTTEIIQITPPPQVERAALDVAQDDPPLKQAKTATAGFRRISDKPVPQPQRISEPEPAVPGRPNAGGDSETPGPLRTSDSWTDATIPRYR